MTSKLKSLFQKLVLVSKSRFVIFSCYFFAIWIMSSKVTFVKSDIVLLIDLLNYTNPTGRLHTGQCCDSYLHQSPCPVLPPKCDVSIKICIDNPENIREIQNAEACPYGTYYLNSMRDINTFNFKINKQAELPFFFTINWKRKNLPRFLLKFFALDDSSDRVLVQKSIHEKLIDFYTVEYNSDQNVIPTNGLSNDITWTNFNSLEGFFSSSTFKTFISFRVAMKCRTNYFTPTCTVRCVQQDSCEGGHYTCDPDTGEKICNEGFTDPNTNCVTRDERVQLCPEKDTDFCYNNGYCYMNFIKASNISLPTCCCSQGFGGPNCLDILTCDNNPCANGGSCLINKTSKFGYCSCQLGFTGKYCDIKISCPKNYYGDDCSVKCEAIDSCEIHQACDYFGRLKCKDGWGSFPECNTRLINPSIDPECPTIARSSLYSTSNASNLHQSSVVRASCINGGSCWLGHCCCTPGFTGSRCELVINFCSSSPCLNGAQCISNWDGFQCVCPSGYTGFFCESMLNPCQIQPSKCSGRGLCIPGKNFASYSCSCERLFTGRNCERQLDYCSSRPCLNNSTCVSFLNEDVGFKCICPTGLTGTYCELTINYCASMPCVMSQTEVCSNDLKQNRYSCYCKPGFTGVNCEINIDYCSSQPCVAGQSERCVNYQWGFTCICKQGYSGSRCEEDQNECLSSPCRNGGTCVDAVNGFFCICPASFTGTLCLTDLNPCTRNPLTNFTVCGIHGNCYPKSFNKFKSEMVGLKRQANSDYFCQCEPGFEGQNCERASSFCALYSPCLNNARCLDLSATEFVCQCDKTHTGRFCERLVNPCVQSSSVPICNSGTCIPSGLNSFTGSLNFTCLCPAMYTGQFCQTFINPCEPSPCVSGRGQCQIVTDAISGIDQSFRCVCRAGYTGLYCEIQMRACDSRPCLNNGACSDLLGAYECKCPLNYYGLNCEMFLACSLNPCNPQGSSQCLDLIMNTSVSSLDSYRCLCKSGFTGAQCQSNINECASQPCLHNSTCIDQVNGFFCECGPTFSGARCEIEVDLCIFNQCALGSTCVPRPPSNYSCLCPANVTGLFCNEQIDACSKLPCRNGGSCLNLIYDYKCICDSSFSGKDCEVVVDQCEKQSRIGGSSSCRNGATCVGYLNGYNCLCPSGYTGQYCDVMVDYCKSGFGPVCMNGGSCINMPSGYRCICANGYTGSRCDSFIDLCNATICQNNGVCRTAANRAIYCTCQNGFTGLYCQIKIDYCQSMPCFNGATCQSFNDRFVCYCPNNFFGTRCENKINFCQSMPCRNNGTCIDKLNEFSCACSPGFSGEICQVQQQPCYSFPCLYGSCINTAIGYKCNCNTGWSGTQCDKQIDLCQTGLNGEPACLNNGTCISGNPYTCVCPSYFTGKRCEVVNDPCLSYPCVRGSCKSLPNGFFRCECPTGFTGLNCDSDFNECESSLSNQCRNNSTCMNIIGGYWCKCSTGFTGKYCENSLNFCASSPCLNGGQCINNFGSNTFTCRCPFGYTGFACEQRIDFCSQAAMACLNNGTCINTPLTANSSTGFRCLCLPGFTGLACEQTLDSCSTKPCMNDGVCLLTLNTSISNFICVCPLGYTGSLCQTKIDLCLNKCQNGGICEMYNSSAVRCVCRTGFTGLNCESIDYCQSFPCLNGGTCSLTYPSGFQCFCPGNFSGNLCQLMNTGCVPNPCFNSGTCAQINGQAKCFCPPAYTGSKCEISMACNPSCMFGQCVKDSLGNPRCVCLPGYTGQSCSVDIDECASAPCRNNASCLQPFSNMYICSCLPWTTGVNCENRLPTIPPTLPTPPPNLLTSFSNLNASFYGITQFTDFNAYRQCISSTWISLNAQIDQNSLLLNLIDKKSGLVFTPFIYANQTTVFIYNITFLNRQPEIPIRFPTQSDYSRFCANVVNNKVYLYTSYWDATICGRISAQNDMDTIRTILIQIWARKYPEIVSSCNCLNVDIISNLTQYLSVPLTGRQVTRIFYLVYANSFTQVIDKSSPGVKVPSQDELATALQNTGYQSCQSQSSNMTFAITICGPLIKSQLPSLSDGLRRSWQTDYATGGGVGSNTIVAIVILNQYEYISNSSIYENSQATQITYSVFVNNQIIDQYFPTPYNYDMIMGSFFSMTNIALCSPDYPLTYQFTVVLSAKPCLAELPLLEYAIKTWYSNLYNVQLPLVRVRIPQASMEELLDDYYNIYYSLPIFINVNGQFVPPDNSTSRLLVEFLQTYSESGRQLKVFKNPNQIKLYRTLLSFKYYISFNLIMQNLNIFSEFVKQSFEKTNKNAIVSQASIKLQQEIVFYNMSSKPSWANQVIVFISDPSGRLYDAREENQIQIMRYLRETLGSFNMIRSELGETLILYDQFSMTNLNIVKQSNLFTFYFTNNYMAVTSSDLTKISSGLDEVWRVYSNNSQSSIFILNNQPYFHKGSIILGINYMVKNQDPSCIDKIKIDKLFGDYFTNKLLPQLCACGYKYYSYPPECDLPTKYFYKLDILGHVDSTEIKYMDIITSGLLGAWSKRYSGTNNIDIVNQFEPRVGELGVLITRVFYIVYINNQLAVSYLYQPPISESIEYEFRGLGSDMKIYPEKYSIAKSQLLSVYVGLYPFTPDYRVQLENNIKVAIDRLNIQYLSNQQSIKNVQVQYYELYTTSKRVNVSRVYYSLCIGGQVLYPCELNDLYAPDIQTIPSLYRFDYMIKSRYLDLISGCGDVVIKPNDLISTIQQVWFSKNGRPCVNISQINVWLGETVHYTSIFSEILIARAYYFVTINGLNINDAVISYVEPNKTDFNFYLYPSYQVSFFFPNRAYRAYLNGDLGSIDTDVFQNSVNFAWAQVNALDSIPVKTVCSIVNPNRTRFYDMMNGYKYMTRIIYRVLFRSYADQNALFNLVPPIQTLKSTLANNGLTLYDGVSTNTLPALFYDFYMLNQLSLSQARQNLIDKIKEAWTIMNSRQSDLYFQSLLRVDIYSVIQYGPISNGSMVYRVIYSIALAFNDNLLDPSDFCDPDDCTYRTIIPSAISSANYSQYISIQSDQVNLTWWMILIIVIAALLLILLLLCCGAIICFRKLRAKNASYFSTALLSKHVPLKELNYEVASYSPSQINSHGTVSNTNVITTVSSIPPMSGATKLSRTATTLIHSANDYSFSSDKILNAFQSPTFVEIPIQRTNEEIGFNPSDALNKYTTKFYQEYSDDRKNMYAEPEHDPACTCDQLSSDYKTVTAFTSSKYQHVTDIRSSTPSINNYMSESCKVGDEIMSNYDTVNFGYEPNYDYDEQFEYYPNEVLKSNGDELRRRKLFYDSMCSGENYDQPPSESARITSDGGGGNQAYSFRAKSSMQYTQDSTRDDEDSYELRQPDIGYDVQPKYQSQFY